MKVIHSLKHNLVAPFRNKKDRESNFNWKAFELVAHQTKHKKKSRLE